jgi:hypothetical protein
MVNMRFGPDTWKEILAERNRRIQEAKEAQIAARKAAQKAQDELIENIKIGSLIVLVMAIAIFLFFFLVFSAAMASSLII